MMDVGKHWRIGLWSFHNLNLGRKTTCGPLILINNQQRNDESHSWHNECSEWTQQFALKLLEKGGPLSSLDFSSRFPKSKPWTSFYKTSARKLTTNQLFLQNARELYRKWADNLKNCTMINKKLSRFTSNINTRVQRMPPILHWKHSL